MKDCKWCRSRLVEALYGELEAKEKDLFEKHTAACPACAAELKALAETLKTMDARVRPEPGQDFWDGYWDRLSRRMEKEERAKAALPASQPLVASSGRRWSFMPRWAFQVAAAVVLIAAGIFIGRTVFSPRRAPLEASQPAGQSPAVQPAEGDAVLRARNYVDRSKLVLLALVNYDPASEDAYGLDLPYQKQVSQDLVRQAGAIKSDLKDPSQRRLRELVSDLEAILLQIANLESKNDLVGVDIVKQGIESGGLLFKINLSEMGGRLSGSGQGVAAEKPPLQKIKT
jgi:hypothetical protein